MADYFVSATRGNNATGTGTASNPWQTIGKAIGATPAITLPGSGPTYLYIEPGLYREAVPVSLTPSATAPLYIVGDCDGAGFLAGGYATPVTGLVDWRAWTNDATPIAGAAITLNGTPYVTLSRLHLIGGDYASGSCVYAYNGSDYLTVRDCLLHSAVGRQAFSVTQGAAGGALNLQIERCDVFAHNSTAVALFAKFNTSEYPLNVVIQNCRIFARSDGVSLSVAVGGSGSYLGTGVAVQSCSFFLASNAVRVLNAYNASLATPITVRGCLVVGCQTGFTAYDSSQISEDYNVLLAGTPRSNVNAGVHSTTSAAPALNCGVERLVGLPARPFSEPLAVGPIGGFDAGGSAPSVDLYNQTRPATPAAGPLEIDSFPGGGSTYIFQTEG